MDSREQFEKWLERRGAAYRALETEVAALRASNAELLAENKRLQDEFLAKLTDAVTRQPADAPRDPGADNAKRLKQLEELREKVRTDPDVGLDVMGQWLQ